MLIEVTSHELLSEIIFRDGHQFSTPCGGKGVCRRCKVRLVSGDWLYEGKTVSAPAEVLACRTHLADACGTVEFSPGKHAGGIAMAWQNIPPVSGRDCVIGIDIGTTTIAAVKYSEGAVIASAGMLNPQSKFGDNVISRIAASPLHLQEMRSMVATAVEKLLEELGTDDVVRIGIAGNTVMLSLFYGIDPTPVGVMPFEPLTKDFPVCRLAGIETFAVPCISGFVGGDLTAGLFCIGLRPGEMLADIGTNCEVIFNTPAGMICTAAAAGPAFEGAGLHCGCCAMTGAVEHYRSKDDYDVAGNCVPAGICGSAYVDWLAVERRAGHLSATGRLQPAAESMYITDDIFVHEYDIGELLKAKAAIYAGIRTVEEHCGCRAGKIWLAGGFARHLDIANAIACGMLPEREYVSVGNTSLAGAVQLALDPGTAAEMRALREGIQDVPLNTLTGFEDNFIDALLLP